MSDSSRSFGVHIQKTDDWFDEWDERYSPEARSKVIRRHMQWGMAIDELFDEYNIPEPESTRDFRMRMRSIIKTAIESDN